MTGCVGRSLEDQRCVSLLLGEMFSSTSRWTSSSTDRRQRWKHFKLIPQKDRHLIEILVWPLNQVFAEGIEHRMCDEPRASTAIWRRFGSAEAAKVGPNVLDRASTAASNFSHLSILLKRLTDNHLTDQVILRGCKIRRHDRDTLIDFAGTVVGETWKDESMMATFCG